MRDTGAGPRALVCRLEHLLLPRNCVGCARGGVPRAAVLGLCVHCAAELDESLDPRCARCSLPLPPGLASGECVDCLRRPPPWNRLEVGWLYRAPLDQVIRAIKFGRLEFLADELGERLASRFASTLREVDLVVPVPLHWRRRLLRGFDQAGSIARAIGRRAEVPVAAALSRRRATPPQARRQRALRQRGLDTAFVCDRPEAVRDRRLVLIDDVVTTGATLRAAARALAARHPRSIIALAAARTPRPDGPVTASR